MSAGSSDRLDSWKEIAGYLRRGARTVQRWEREEGLPVHRLRHEKLGSVYAYRAELDQWWQSRRSDLENDATPVREGHEPSVAVLPFRDMSREKDQEYFCEGIAEEIIQALSRLRGLRVASRTSSFRARSDSGDAREVGRRLRVQTLLEGSVRKAGDRLRISVQLTDCEKGFQVWSESYDRQLSDVFAIQEEIASHVAAALEVTLTPKEQEALAKPPTTDLEAYDLYLRGRAFYYGYGPQEIEAAIQLFTRAIARDPNYANAYAGLADCWSYIYMHVERNETVLQQAVWATDKAVNLDPESAQAHTSRAIVISLAGRVEEAEAEFEAAARLEPRLFEAHYFYARHCFAQGRPEQALKSYEEAMSIRPDDYQSPLLCAQIFDDTGRPDEGRAMRVKGIENAEQHLARYPQDARAMYMAANGMAALGRREQAWEYTKRALALRPEDPMLLYNVACIASLLGNATHAIEWLEKSVNLGMHLRGWLLHDSNLDPLRSDPRFIALLERVLH